MSETGYKKWVTVPGINNREHELGFDEEGMLYWDKRRVLTEQKLSLPSYVNVSIVFGAVFTGVLAVTAVLEYCGG